jgi:mRNA-degrading endonuclease RelE of RelBE toxin-antitoxin system
MRSPIVSRIMPRTTLDLDASVLRDLKRLQKRAGKSLGQLVSELVTAALARSKAGELQAEAPAAWKARAMGARVDLEDKEALRAALDAP